VKENEKFKVAKEIIEKYGSPEDLAEIGVTNNRSKSVNASNNVPRKQQPTLHDTSDSDHEIPPSSAGSTPNPDQRLAMMKRQRIGAFNQAFITPAMRRQPIRPFIQPTRTPIDKIIDYIVGDGPSNRFALICRNCRTHNGMALSEEFYDMAFVCFNCNLYNPARNADPHFKPQISPANQLFLTESPVTTPMIRTATNSESSDNEEDVVNAKEEENDTLKNNGKPDAVDELKSTTSEANPN